MLTPRSALLLMLCCLLVGALRADDPETIAGRTVEQYAAQIDDGDRVVRLRAVKSLGAFGASAAVPLRRALEHEDAAVRYTAAVHLGRIGGPPLSEAKPSLEKLAGDESSMAVQMAASYALCRVGMIDQHLPLLVDALTFPERGTACSAAELIGAIGPDAADAIEPLEQVYQRNRPGVKGGDYHIGGAANNALRKIRDSE